MLYRIGADAVLLLHLSFILFVLFGGLLVAWRRGFLLLHLPAVAWGIYIELSGGACPLTYWENLLRLAGNEGYEAGFIEHLLPLIYPDWLSTPVQCAGRRGGADQSAGLWLVAVAATPQVTREGAGTGRHILHIALQAGGSRATPVPRGLGGSERASPSIPSTGDENLASSRGSGH